MLAFGAGDLGSNPGRTTIFSWHFPLEPDVWHMTGSVSDWMRTCNQFPHEMKGCKKHGL